MADLSNEALDEIQKRADAATKGPWTQDGRADVIAGPFMGNMICRVWNNCRNTVADASFIAHARNDVPALLSALREARREIERLQAVIGVENTIAALESMTGGERRVASSPASGSQNTVDEIGVPVVFADEDEYDWETPRFTVAVTARYIGDDWCKLRGAVKDRIRAALVIPAGGEHGVTGNG